MTNNQIILESKLETKLTNGTRTYAEQVCIRTLILSTTTQYQFLLVCVCWATAAAAAAAVHIYVETTHQYHSHRLYF